MKRPMQKDINPFEYSDSNKRYYTYDYYLKHRYGTKVAKITLDAGFTCPNIDGKAGLGGCIYCSGRGSGDFAQSSLLSISEQYEKQVKLIKSKWDTDKFIPYLQAHTNTYASIDTLRKLYEEVVSLPGAVGVNIATRADCLDDEVVELLKETAEKTDLTVELGLQSTNDITAKIINRCHTYQDFILGYTKLRNANNKIRLSVHLINGLPGEDFDTMINSAKEVAKLLPNEVKIHLLHVLKGTPLEKMYERGDYQPMTEEDYINTVVSQLEVLPKSTVIGRLTGDGKEDDLLSPLWSKKKVCVLNNIDKALYIRDTFQGAKYQKAEKT